MEDCCGNKTDCCSEKTKVTDEDVKGAIDSEEYMTIGKKTTLCLITLKNGFEVIGTSACVDPANYDIEVGKPYAKDRALSQVWMHLASILQENLQMKKQETILDQERPNFPEGGL